MSMKLSDSKDFDRIKYTKLDYGYLDYTYIQKNFIDKDIEKRADKLRNLFSKHTKIWTDELNSEWIARNYSSLKFILSTNLLLSSLQYSFEKNLKIVLPYLSYYSMLTACRSYIMTLPNERWNEGKILSQTHDKTIKITYDSLRSINQTKAKDFKDAIYKSKSVREIFSYRFPSKGLSVLDEKFNLKLEDTLNYCGLLCELAQLNSEILEYSFQKNADGKEYSIIEEVFWEIVQYEDISSGIFFVDDFDLHRIGQLTRNPEPINIFSSMREGLIDDFFSSWEYPSDVDKIVDKNNTDKFFPNPRIVFSLP